MSTQEKRVWPSGHRTKESMAVRTPDPGCDPGSVHDKKPPKWEAFLLNLGLIAWRGTSVTLDPFLSLPWPVVLTRAKKVWPSGHRTSGGTPRSIARCGSTTCPRRHSAFYRPVRKHHLPAEALRVLLPSAGAQYGCSVTLPSGATGAGGALPPPWHPAPSAGPAPQARQAPARSARFC